MYLVDIIIRYTYTKPVPIPTLVAKIPNGNPLPDKTWERAETAISPDEAHHLLTTKYQHITQPKC